MVPKYGKFIGFDPSPTYGLFRFFNPWPSRHLSRQNAPIFWKVYDMRFTTSYEFV
jgi:hypothetical protein